MPSIPRSGTIRRPSSGQGRLRVSPGAGGVGSKACFRSGAVASRGRPRQPRRRSPGAGKPSKGPGFPAMIFSLRRVGLVRCARLAAGPGGARRRRRRTGSGVPSAPLHPKRRQRPRRAHGGVAQRCRPHGATPRGPTAQSGPSAPAQGRRHRGRSPVPGTCPRARGHWRDRIIIGDRGVAVGGSVSGSTIVTGDGNRVELASNVTLQEFLALLAELRALIHRRGWKSAGSRHWSRTCAWSETGRTPRPPLCDPPGSYEP